LCFEWCDCRNQMRLVRIRLGCDPTFDRSTSVCECVCECVCVCAFPPFNVSALSLSLQPICCCHILCSLTLFQSFLDSVCVCVFICTKRGRKQHSLSPSFSLFPCSL